MAKTESRPARVLVAVDIEGVALRPNDIVPNVTDDILKAYPGVFDPEPSAVAAAREAGGREIGADKTAA